MDRQAAAEYAKDWAEAWNRRDLDAILAHFADDVVFSSPVALQVAGRATVRGKAALRGYWEAALGRVRSLRFAVDRVIWDAAARELAIVYDRDVDGRRERAAEVLRFDRKGKVESGEVFYGVIPG